MEGMGLEGGLFLIAFIGFLPAFAATCIFCGIWIVTGFLLRRTTDRREIFRKAALLGIPLALGSWWGLLMFAPTVAAIIWRLLDEERLLTKNLSGYADYKNKVRYRLVLWVW